MNKEFHKPDFYNSILNIAASLSQFLGQPNANPTLKVLDEQLQKGYKNVVFICFDALGITPLEINLPQDDFLRRHVATTVLSTFPSTTVNATKTLTTNTYPLEHGTFGWCMNFPEINRNIEVFPHTDPATGEVVPYNYPLPQIPMFFMFSKSPYQVHGIFPTFFPQIPTVSCHNTDSLDVLFDTVKDICNSDGNHMIYSYYPDPDHSMHDYGVTSDKAKEIITAISQGLERLQSQTRDTLFIISADHGQIDVEGYVEFYKDKELNDMLICPPYLDARSPAFRVKEGFHDIFAQKFTQRYGDDFVLYKSQDLIDWGYFGPRGSQGYLLGDYIAIGTYTNKQFLVYETDTRFKGLHTSLTDEMLVPVILITN